MHHDYSEDVAVYHHEGKQVNLYLRVIEKHLESYTYKFLLEL